MNTLYYGDCLDVIPSLKAGSVDLIYLDPPFNSRRNYHNIYKDETGRPLPDQVEAFCDMWTLTPEREREIRHMPVLVRQTGIDDATAEFWKTWLNALRKTNPALLAYLSYMVIRLAHMRVLLKPTGTLYLHCDPTASHYIKVMLDGVFGHDNFRNEIIWKRTGAHGRAKRWGPIHDVILFYSRSEKYFWNRTFQPLDTEYIENYYKAVDDHGQYRLVTLDGPGERTGASGQPWKGVDPSLSGRHWEVPPDRALPPWIDRPINYAQMSVQERLDVLDAQGLIYWPPKGSIPQYKRYLMVSRGNPIQDIISDIRPVGSHSKERLGYQTQKPRTLLERIIEASTPEDGVVCDPFCGCATTLEAAHRLGRRWIGIDIAIHAIKRVARIRLTERCGLVEGTDFEVRGVPRDVEGAHDLWKRNPYHFQKWAVEHVDGFVTTKQTADGGIDGRLYFAHPDHEDLQSMVIEVKGGATVNIADVRALGDVLARDSALLAGLIVMDVSPGKAKNFGALMAEAGDLDVLGVKYPRMQMLTVAQIVAGERFNTPSVAARHVVAPRLPGT